MNIELGIFEYTTSIDILEGALVLSAETRARHTYIAGKTGTGKSALQLNIAAQLAQQGGGFAFFDPHGDAAAELVSRIPAARADDIAHIDLADLSASVGLNFMAGVPTDRISVVADNYLSSFIAIFGREAVADRSQEVFRNALKALMEREGQSLLSVVRLLRDDKFQHHMIAGVRDLLCRSYWQDEFTDYDSKFREQVVAPILNKLDALLSHVALRHILSQPKSTIDLRKIIDEGRILIIRLRKGSIGVQAARFMGALIFSGLMSAALSRDDLPEHDRRPFDVLLDEAQSFVTPEIATVLSELRKYGLYLTMASQYLDQIPKDVRAAVFGNVGTLVSFRLGADDARLMAKELGFDDPSRIIDLKNFRALVRTLNDKGEPRPPVEIKTYPPAAPLHGQADAMLRNARRLATPRAKVESQIRHILEA